MNKFQYLYKKVTDVFKPKVKVIRTYSAAKNSPTMNIPDQGSGTVNDEIGDSWQEVTERTLGLVRDFPLFAGAVANAEAFVVADGIVPQLVAPMGSSDRHKKQLQEIEDRFMKWAKDRTKCDTEGRLNFFEMTALTERQEGEFGEFIAIDNYSRKGGYSVHMTEPLNLQDLGFHRVHGQSNGNNIWRGIEYNPNTKRPVAYHFTDPADANSFYKTETIRIPANRVHHGFKTVRAGQMRGISPFASVILSSYQLRDYIGAELTSQNLSSRWMAFVTAPPSGFHSDYTNEDNVELNSTYNKYVKSLDYATIEYLKHGEQVHMNTQTRSSNGLESFNEIITRYIATAYQMPYELISQNYSGLNFTTLRAVRNDFKQQLRPKWQRKISQFCQPIFEAWLRHEVLSGTLNIPDYFSNPEKYTTVKWITPTLASIDPLKEFSADLMKVRAGVKSIQQVIKEEGEDPDKVLDELKTWQEKLNEAGLNPPELTNQTPMISNFEIIEEPEEEKEPEVKKDSSVGVDDEGRLYRKKEGGEWELQR